MTQIQLTNFGQIQTANIKFGDLTLFVGPQATGKSLLLQLIKLLIDRDHILYTIEQNGYDWEQNVFSFMEFYYGEGMGKLWNSKKTTLHFNLHQINLPEFLQNNRESEANHEPLNIRENIFFIPAQRVLTLENGWPRSFTSFDLGTPYIVRRFSENLRLLIEHLSLQNRLIFPQKERFNSTINQTISETIFHQSQVTINTVGMRKRIQINFNNYQLPFMAWSAGQREFMPLLLSLYHLTPIPKNRSKSRPIDWVIIEEPEMGLHPRAILSVMLIFLELLDQGYRLIISTHSPVMLEAIWAIRILQQTNPQPKYCQQMFELEPSESMTKLFKNILNNKKFSTYYFEDQHPDVVVRNISSLDPFDPDSAIADWGGLTSFSSKVSEIISEAVQAGESN